MTEQAGNAKLQFVETLLGHPAAPEHVYRENRGEERQGHLACVCVCVHTKIRKLNAETPSGRVKETSAERKRTQEQLGKIWMSFGSLHQGNQTQGRAGHRGWVGGWSCNKEGQELAQPSLLHSGQCPTTCMCQFFQASLHSCIPFQSLGKDRSSVFCAQSGKILPSVYDWGP